MEMDDCPCSGRTLGRLIQPAAMAVLASEPLHGYLVVQRLQRMAMFRDQRPDPTGLYRLLKEMEKEGLLSSRWDLPDTGSVKRRFALTARGRACKARWIRSLKVYQQAIDELLAILTRSGKAARRGPAARQGSRRQKAAIP